MNQGSLFKMDAINFKLKRNKISWFNTIKKSSNMNLIEMVLQI